jgi:hypothetical protein
MGNDVLTRARRALFTEPAPASDLASVRRRARTLRVHRALAIGAASAVVAVGLVGPMVALWGLGQREEVPADETPTPIADAPMLDFEPAPGWHVVTTDPAHADVLGVQASASNVPFVEGDVPTAAPNSFPNGYPAETEQSLPPDGIIIVAQYPIRTRNPLPPNRTFPTRSLPLTIDEEPSVGYEGQDPDRALAVVNATVNERYVSVQIIFGTGDPTPALIREADEELGRLIVAPPPTTTTAIDDFGIRMDVPDDWHAILFNWGALPVLHASTVPIVDLYDGASARSALGPDDLLLVLSQNDAYAARYEEISLPVEIRSEDVCPTCEILDDGTSPPADHTLFYGSFAVSGRRFDLFVEFGTPSPTARQIEELNAVLATLAVDPPTTSPPSEATSGAVPAAPITVDLPAGWIEKDEPVPGTVGPRVVAAYGTWDFPTGGECGPEPALADLPADGALVWFIEYADPGNAGDFISVLPQFSIDVQNPPARWECAAAAPSRMYMFRDGGRFFEVHVAFGPEATGDTLQQANELITSLHADPAA